MSTTSISSILNAADISSKKEDSFLQGGSNKTDFYYMLGDSSHQTLYTYETRALSTPLGKASFGVGTDYKLDDGDKLSKTVFDSYLSVPFIENFALKGRIRTNYYSSNPTTQFRSGIAYNQKINDGLSLYALTYAADKLSYHGRKTDYLTGFYTGLDCKLTDKMKFYVEAQDYDLKHTSKDKIGLNCGFKYTF